MKVAITGASGLIGRALTASLVADGHDVQRFVRGTSTSNAEIEWKPAADGAIDTTKLVDTDAVVHLAGEPLVGLRWTQEKKRRILESRVDGTRLIATTLATLDVGPRVLVSASAVGYYGDTRDWVDETSARGEGFLAEVCHAWELEARYAREAGLRVVHPRLGVVLAADGGALAKMLPSFRLGAGGPLGSGEQYFPWIALDDVVAALRFLLDNEIDGPVNLVAPNPVTNAEFTTTLAKQLNRPAFMRVPAFALRAALGEMGEETLLAGQRARPARLIAANFDFRFPVLADALAHLFAEPAR